MEGSALVLFPPLEGNDDGGNIEKELARNFRLIKQSKSSVVPTHEVEEANESVRQLAMETALMAQKAVEKMQRSIAELEGLLEEQCESDDEVDDDNPPSKRRKTNCAGVQGYIQEDYEEEENMGFQFSANKQNPEDETTSKEEASKPSAKLT